MSGDALVTFQKQGRPLRIRLDDLLERIESKSARPIS